MRSIELNRQKIGLEDITRGTGTETQIRGGQEVEITQLSFATLMTDIVIETGDADTEVSLSGDTLTIPRGSPGYNGIDGMTPQYEFTYNEATGNLEYNLIGYIESTDIPSEEI